MVSVIKTCRPMVGIDVDKKDSRAEFGGPVVDRFDVLINPVVGGLLKYLMLELDW